MPQARTPQTRAPEERAYHHGDLRRALLDAAVALIAERGTAAISLRDLARRAGVSHAAPAHHFKDKSGLFTAIAAEGHRLLAASIEAEAVPASKELLEMGVRYVRFALAHPAHFEVMFQPGLLRRDDPDLRAAQAQTGELLRSGLPLGTPVPDAESSALAAWSLAHGFATLCLSGNVSRFIGERDPADAFRDIVRASP
ncbi:TetR/AcrR family transcriptional regulator [Wenjunlia tyrosinilytica]|nr:TetR/AcrR family transcriptional regulator [Wenjunlia tyrosinilytica]